MRSISSVCFFLLLCSSSFHLIWRKQQWNKRLDKRKQHRNIDASIFKSWKKHKRSTKQMAGAKVYEKWGATKLHFVCMSQLIIFLVPLSFCSCSKRLHCCHCLFSYELSVLGVIFFCRRLAQQRNVRAPILLAETFTYKSFFITLNISCRMTISYFAWAQEYSNVFHNVFCYWYWYSFWIWTS